jgi:hypothetical protein
MHWHRTYVLGKMICIAAMQRHASDGSRQWVGPSAGTCCSPGSSRHLAQVPLQLHALPAFFCSCKCYCWLHFCATAPVSKRRLRLECSGMAGRLFCWRSSCCLAVIPRSYVSTGVSSRSTSSGSVRSSSRQCFGGWLGTTAREELRQAEIGKRSSVVLANGILESETRSLATHVAVPAVCQ